MAKWGEGDPRWIVEERPDTINVNNWHWTEKNATLWSKEKLKELFNDFTIAEYDMECKIYECTATGEAYVNNRKGKLIYFYEWEIKLKWRGYLPGNAELCEGTVSIPNLSEENALDEVDITIGMEDSSNDKYKLRSFMYNSGRDKIRKQLGIYIFDLKEKFSQGMILPKKDDDVTATKPIAQTKVKIDMKPLNAENNNNNTDKSIGVKLDVKTFKTTESFQCRVEDLYNSLTRIEMVTAFTRGHVKLEVFKGGEFSFFGGNISGKFEEIIPNKRIKQLWRYKQWPAGYYSNVTMDFEEKEDHTDLILTHDGIPTNEYDTIRLNWKNYYFTMMKETFGFGSFLK